MLENPVSYEVTYYKLMQTVDHGSPLANRSGGGGEISAHAIA